MTDEQAQTKPEATDQQDTLSETSKTAAELQLEAEAAESMAAAANEIDPLVELQAALATAKQQATDNWDTVLRTRAEMENVRKRAQRDIENAHKFALEKIASELLAVRDSMELGLNVARESQNPDSLLEGTELTLKMLQQLMEKFAITPVDPVGEKFNPEQHQAVATQANDAVAPGHVIAVMQKGYLLKGRLLRPALVTVAKAPEATDNDRGTMA